MHHLHMEHFAMIDSPVHRLDARVKIVVMAVYIVMVTVAPGGWPSLAAALFPVALIAISRVPRVYLLKRAALTLPFVGAVVAFMPFLPGEHVLWETNVLGYTVHLTREGLSMCADVCVKAFLCVLTVLALTATTRFELILKALHSMKVPAVLVLLLSFLYRYLFVLFDQAMRMRRSRDARSPRRPRAGFRVATGMIGSLFLRTYTRAERVYQAMLARGFSGDVHTMTDWRPGRRDVVFATVSTCYFTVLALLWKGSL